MRNQHSLLAILFMLILACSGPEKPEERPALTISPFPVRELPDDVPYEIDAETSDDPSAREAFDVLRFRDPATGKIPDGIRAAEIEFARNLPVSKGFSYRTSSGRTVNANLDFSSAGPVNVGGRTRALAIDVNNTNRIIAGGVSGGLWLSGDRGTSWTRVTSVSTMPNIRSIIQDTRPGNENVWFYGTGEIEPGNSTSLPQAPYRGNGIYRSNDNGVTWTQVVSTSGIDDLSSPFNYVHNLALDRSNTTQRELYAAALGGIYRSTDNFATATLTLGSENFSGNSTWTEVAVTSTGIVYATLSSENNNAGAPSGIYRSVTGQPGSWEEITPPTGYTGAFRRIVIGISPSNENIVYFLGNKRDDNVLHKYDASAPEGQRWTDLTENIPMFGGQVGDYNAQSSYNMLVTVHPADENIVFLGGTNLYRSTSGFSNTEDTQWVGGYTRNNNSNSYFNHHPDQHSLAFFPNNPDEMLSAHDGGLSITENNRKTSLTEVTDGNGNVVQEVVIVWEELNNAYLTSQFYTLAIDEENVGDPSLLGGMQDNSTYILQSQNRSADWINIGAGDGSYCYYDLRSVIVSAQFSNLFRYALVNDSFEFFNISTPNAGDDEFNLFVNPFIIDPVAPNKMFVGGRGVIYYTLNVRQNPRDEEWLTFGSGALPTNQRVSAFGASVEPQGVLYVATEAGRLFRVNNSTLLAGITDVTNGLPSGYISSVMVDPTNADNVMVAYSNYNMQSIYYSTNGGDSWFTVGGNLENDGITSVGAPSVRWLAYVPNDGNPLYLAGTSAGLFSTSSLNGGNTVWEREGAESIGLAPVDMIKVRPIDGTIVVATHGNGVFEASTDIAFKAHLQVMDIRCSPGEVTLQANLQLQGVEDQYNLQYEWFANGQPLNINGQGIITTSEGTYTVRVTNAVTGESDLSNPVEISFSQVSTRWCNDGITSVGDELNETVSVYPNPTDGPLTVKAPADRFDLVTVIDLKGNIVLETSLSGSASISVAHLPSGVYLVEFSGREEKITRRIVKISTR